MLGNGSRLVSEDMDPLLLVEFRSRSYSPTHVSEDRELRVTIRYLPSR